MTLIIILFFVGIIFAVLSYLFRDEGEALPGITFAISFCSFLILFIVLIAIPFCRDSDRTSIAKYEAFKSTIQNQRERYPNSVESTTILKEISDWNQNIAGLKHNNKVNWDWWTVDEVEKLEPIK